MVRVTAPVLVSLVLLGGCAGTAHLEIETSRFPVPVMQKAPVRLGIHLDDTLTSYIHKETIEKKGDFEVAVGPAQKDLFNNLAMGVFEGYEFVSENRAPHLDGVLKPNIAELQFSLPSQTRSDYYEIWIRYQFQLFDREGNLIGNWTLPAYGKASQKDHGSKSTGLEEAALAACRDAMAFFSINFTRETMVSQWLAAGKPLVPPQPAAPAAQTAAAAAPAAAPAAATPATPDPAAPSTVGEDSGGDTSPDPTNVLNNENIAADAATGAT